MRSFGLVKQARAQTLARAFGGRQQCAGGVADIPM
jgi:hypothetical protein